MTAEQTFTLLKDFFENRPVVRQALSPLHTGVEIGLNVGTLKLTLRKTIEGVTLLNHPPANHDVSFSLDPITARRLISEGSDNVGQWGVQICKEIIAGRIVTQLPGSIWNLLRRGYLPVLLRGGTELRHWLVENGYGDIPALLRKLKRPSEN